MRLSRQECALEQGWLLWEMAQCFGYSVQELARRFDRSMSWVSRRLALVELLPQTIQQQVREACAARIHSTVKETVHRHALRLAASFHDR